MGIVSRISRDSWCLIPRISFNYTRARLLSPNTSNLFSQSFPAAISKIVSQYYLSQAIQAALHSHDFIHLILRDSLVHTYLLLAPSASQAFVNPLIPLLLHQRANERNIQSNPKQPKGNQTTSPTSVSYALCTHKIWKTLVLQGDVRLEQEENKTKNFHYTMI